MKPPTKKEVSAFLAPFLTPPKLESFTLVASIFAQPYLALTKAQAIEILRLGFPVNLVTSPTKLGYGIDSSLEMPGTVDTETLIALAKWAREHGQEWPDRLRIAWYRASAPPALQRLRNERGPAWLAEVEALALAFRSL